MTSKYSCLSALLALLATASAFAQTSFKDFKHDVLMDAGDRHLELGVWCRDRGLTSQAAVEIYAAVELSESRHPGAVRVLAIMRSLDDAFWKKNRRRPSKGSINAYAQRAARVRLRDQKDRIALADYAWKKDLRAEATSEYESLIRKIDSPLDVDPNGCIRLGRSTVPVEISKSLLSEAVTINGDLYLRDAFLELIPDVDAIQQVESESLRVRGVASPEAVKDVHSLGEALLPYLEEDLPGRPLVRMNLFMFAERANYDRYLAATGRSAYKSVSGFAQSSNLTAVICAEGMQEHALHKLILHELTHLYVYSMTRAVMPSWYSEGYAELFGGAGTFAWDGANLELREEMTETGLASLRERRNRFSLEEILSANALEMWGTSPERAHQFYAQSWAFLYFLRNAADKNTRDLLRSWEQRCFGSATGAQVGNFDPRHTQPATQLFREMLAEDLPEIEEEFLSWLDDLLLP